MPDVRANVIIGVKQEGAAALQDLSRSLNDNRTKLTSLNDVTKKSTDYWKEFKGILTTTGFVVGGITAGYAALGKAFNMTAGETVKYAAQVRSLSRAIGATAEDSSKLIQAADDVFVSFDTLKLGMIAAIRHGLSPTIAGMGELADKYVSIQDPIARTKFLTDNFGRSGAELAPLLALGAEGIRRLGDEAAKTGLVMSGPAVDAALKYEQQMDRLSDAGKGLQYTIGNGIIPVVTSYANLLNNVIATTRDTISATEGWQPPLFTLIGVLNNLAGNKALATQAAYAEILRQKDEDLIPVLQGVGDAARYAAGQLDGQTQSLIELQVQSFLAAASVDKVQAAIAALQDKEITVTVRNVQIGLTGGYMNTREAEDAGKGKRASGGQLNGAAEVGDQGTEGILPKPGGGFMVVPHGRWEQMKKGGAWRGKGFGLGGDVENPPNIVIDGGRHKTKEEVDRFYAAHENANLPPGMPPAPPSTGEIVSGLTATLPETLTPIMSIQALQAAKASAEVAALLGEIKAILRTRATDSGVGQAVSTALQQGNMMG